MRTAKVYYHPSGYLLIWNRSISCWYLAKVLTSGKLKKHYTGGYSFDPSWRKAVSEIRKRSVKLPVHDWERFIVKYRNTIEAFDQAIVDLHK